MPNRRSPGVVLQGDSLRALLAEARVIYKHVQYSENEDLKYAALSIVETLYRPIFFTTSKRWKLMI